ncbi:hypothetical protein DS891_14670 [Pseudoalteromonas sp. JC28]|uniref:hypothetical protein n=1 Tax=Pseudoalteromonas sp. JC28 TaxID=2267617 RepID=UPI00157204D9|nr:hypothetical protein [Pseudoalteromonas sp. JC28]NSY34785.1 hypothetical protein [Pseudoalteromonas sp. JC28]
MYALALFLYFLSKQSLKLLFFGFLNETVVSVTKNGKVYINQWIIVMAQQNKNPSHSTSGNSGD